MRTFAQALHDRFDGLRLPIRSPKPRTTMVNESNEANGEDGNARQGATAEETAPQITYERHRLDALSDFRIGPSEIKFTSSRSHGSGGKADVGQATFRRKIWTAKQLVAVKKHRHCSDINKGKFANDFILEVEVMAGLSHESIVQLIGFVEDLENGIAWVILSWVPNGNVSEFLATGDWEIPERVSLIQDTFEGIKYLHSRQPPICHGDLKSFNILVSASYRAVITDFGSARAVSASEDEVMSDEDGQQVQAISSTEQACSPIHVGAARNQLTLTGPAWSLRWAAPEVVNGRRPGLSSDIWAAGWVMTNNVPFPELNSEGVITLTVIHGEVPSPREDTQLAQIVALCSLMTDCWAFDPKARPNIVQCSDELKWMPSTPPLGGMRSGSEMPSIKLLLKMGETHLWQSNHEKAIPLFQQALSLARASGDETDVADALAAMARAYFCQAKYNQAEEWFIRAQEVYTRLGNDRGLANAFRGLGDVYRYQDKYVQAEVSHMQAQEIFARLGDDLGLAYALTGLGDAYSHQANYTQAEESLIRAQEIHGLLGNDQGRANALGVLGKAYRLQSKYVLAEESFTRAQEIYGRLGDDQGRAHALCSMGYIYHVQSRYIQAEETYIQAREIYARLGSDRGRAHTLFRLGDVYRLQSKYTRAEESFTAAQEIFTRIGSLPGQADTLRSMGLMRQDQGQNAGAAAHLADAMNLYDHMGRTKDAVDVLRELALVLPEETSSATPPDPSVPSTSHSQ
ncbi:hypothetical protein M407DRAFT_28119 [Tulasnella calospora MUT 4182]|uniref:Protein kinase domain-containing protein n=1 Tax=Tulasnella calospora MUT 4182 TaxID=1051891 RepID=A0A0C3QBA0_9AGAM|nr:hypothetical protein M407DRAFT_28119 [Tulasnella calospora MUT 4182]